MVSGAARVIKLSKNLRPFVSRVVRNGRVQIAFREQIGKPVGACVAGKVRTGMSGAEIHRAVYDCSRQAVGKKLSLAPIAVKARAEVVEYTEVV